MLFGGRLYTPMCMLVCSFWYFNIICIYLSKKKKKKHYTRSDPIIFMGPREVNTFGPENVINEGIIECHVQSVSLVEGDSLMVVNWMRGRRWGTSKTCLP